MVNSVSSTSSVKQSSAFTMSVQVVDYDEELVKVWALVNELSEQLANNRALVTQLKSRADNAKGQAAHVGAGFPLRRFNLDISDEVFQTELESFASHLVLENQTLQHENKQLNTLLKEYEQTLETVMGKFRGVAHASQQHDLNLHQYYSSLLQSLQTAHTSAQLHDDTSLSLLLTRLSTLLRSALRSLNGEGGDVDDQVAQMQLPDESRSPGSHSPVHHSPSPVSSPRSSPTRSGPASSSRYPRGPPRRHQFPGFLPGSSGGYFGTEGQGDWAMEREMEIQRLEEENQALREMLGIAEEIAAEDPEPVPESPVINPHPRPSLTVEELEASAEQEAAEAKERAEHPEAHEPEAQSQSSPVDESVLGFRANADMEQPLPESVFEETEGEANLDA